MTIQIGTIELLAVLAVWALVAYVKAKCEQGCGGMDTVPGGGIGQAPDDCYCEERGVAGFRASRQPSGAPSP